MDSLVGTRNSKKMPDMFWARWPVGVCGTSAAASDLTTWREIAGISHDETRHYWDIPPALGGEWQNLGADLRCPAKQILRCSIPHSYLSYFIQFLSIQLCTNIFYIYLYIYTYCKRITSTLHQALPKNLVPWKPRSAATSKAHLKGPEIWVPNLILWVTRKMRKTVKDMTNNHNQDERPSEPAILVWKPQYNLYNGLTVWPVSKSGSGSLGPQSPSESTDAQGVVRSQVRDHFYRFYPYLCWSSLDLSLSQVTTLSVAKIYVKSWSFDYATHCLLELCWSICIPFFLLKYLLLLVRSLCFYMLLGSFLA